MSRTLTDLIALPSFKASLKSAGESTTSIRGDFDINIELASDKSTVHAAADYVLGHFPSKDYMKTEPCSVDIQAKQAFGATNSCLYG